MTLNLADVPVFGSAERPAPNWVRVGATEEKFHIVTRVDGFVLALSGVDIVGVESEEFWLLDAILIAKCLADVGVAAGKQIVKSYISRSSKRVVTTTLDGATATIAEEFASNVAERTAVAESAGASSWTKVSRWMSSEEAGAWRGRSSMPQPRANAAQP